MPVGSLFCTPKLGQSRTVWSLSNAFTEALKGNLVEFPRRTEALHGLLDNHVGLAAPELIPSGRVSRQRSWGKKNLPQRAGPFFSYPQLAKRMARIALPGQRGQQKQYLTNGGFLTGFHRMLFDRVFYFLFVFLVVFISSLPVCFLLQSSFSGTTSYLFSKYTVARIVHTLRERTFSRSTKGTWA